MDKEFERTCTCGRVFIPSLIVDEDDYVITSPVCDDCLDADAEEQEG